MRLRFIIFLTAFLISGLADAQFSFSFDPAPEVLHNDKALELPWAGGLNAAQYSSADINGDGKQDLVLYDRTSANIQTFLNRDTHWEYAPLYERFFPADLEGWMLLRDYDCDGREDLFTRSPFGIRVFRNNAPAGETIRFVLFKNIVFTEGNSGQINLQVNITDIPAIEDIDDDGDLDILTFNPGLGGNVEYHQNMSLENYGTCDSLEYVRVVDNWGDFQECFCQDFAFGETCKEKNGGRLLHASGKALMAIDIDEDGDRDLIYGDESCNEIMYLENIGDKDNALIRDYSVDFPNAVNPAAFSIFPSGFFLDLDFDGKENMIFSPNVFANYTTTIDFRNSNWIYRNSGTPGNPDYQLEGTNFLQEQMIDLGENAAPALADLDGDGDLDLLIGHSRVDAGQLVHSLAFYENTGTPSIPQFVEQELDYEGLSSLGLRGIHPYLLDYDGDGKVDLLISGTDNPPIKKVLFFRNTAGAAEGLQINNTDNISLDIDLTTADMIAFLDTDLDGDQDILAGTTQGNLQYYANTGSMSYDLIQNDYAGISPDPQRPGLVPFAADLNGNGEPELITLDRSGKLRVFQDIRLSPTPESFEELILEDESLPLTHSSFGERTLLAASDLYNTGFPSLILGSAQGGLWFLANESLDGEPVSGKLSFIVYPNPAGAENSLITIRSNRPGVFDLVSISGQTIRKGFEVPGNSNFQMDVLTLPPGVYVLVGRSNGYGSSTQRVIVGQ